MKKEPKMLLTIIADNSASMKGNKIDLLKDSIADFNKKIQENNLFDRIEYSIVVFNGFHANTFKDFRDNNFAKDKLFAGGVPMFDRALELALEQLNVRKKSLDDEKCEYYKPWVVLLMDGNNFGELDNVVSKLKKQRDDNKLTFFPFKLSDNPVDESFKALSSWMHPLSIINNQYDSLFTWMFNVLEKRINTPIGQNFSLSPDGFDGWVRK